MNGLKRFRVFVCVPVLILWLDFSNFALAQEAISINIPSSLNPVGSGARALGMGNAFIAVADDATAASWNPAGLMQVKTPEVSAVGAFFHRIEDNNFGINPEASGKEGVSKTRLNYLSATYPFELIERNMVVSVSYQNLFDFTRRWDFPITTADDSRLVKHEQKGGLNAFGIAYSIQILEQLSFGFTLNIWEDIFSDNSWEANTREDITGTLPSSGERFVARVSRKDQFSFSGFNANVGFLWSVSDQLTIGGVIKTPFTADLQRERDETLFLQILNSEDQMSTNHTTQDEKLDMPLSFGIGLAYRYSDQLTVSADFFRTEWEDFVRTDSEGNKTSPVSGLSINQSDLTPTNQFRVGLEYLFIKPNYLVPLRGGIFYDPAPAEGSPDKFFGVSFGTGIVLEPVVFDIAYQYRFGRNVGGSILRDRKFSQDVDEHSIYSSIIIHF